jgi:acyl-CoA synthetase (AMP-forming)/AMP-acid ligase II/acyl carrier protein/peptidoglycan/LPS O-acetylase OafA/YrhL
VTPEVATAAPIDLRTTTTGHRPPVGEVVPFVARLASHGARTALVAPDGDTISYADLAERAAEVATALGPVRRLVMVAASSDVDAVVAYLGALAGGHPVLLVAPGTEHASAVTAVYSPDVVMSADDGWAVRERHEGTVHGLHPDLALLLTTSGSTGSPKLVRLSQDNLQSNAVAIGDYLDLRPADRGLTTLPIHYCYGLSVVHSHLAAGASISLTHLSVTDPCLWDQVRRDGVTGIAGVPYSFEMLERVGFADMDLPSLRYLTQAGGRMPPERVRAFAELGRDRGFDLFVMYGATEATARMAYLPPSLAIGHPSAIGVPVPGGDLAVDAAPGTDVGELVYRGPNVMLGYAEGSEDLALGRTVHELRTGDLGRRTPDGLFVVVGRASRFLKLFGLRVDLDRTETLLAERGVVAVCTGDDRAVVVGVETAALAALDPDAAIPDRTERLRGLVSSLLGLPRSAVRVVVAEELPRLASGKPDLRRLRAFADADDELSSGDDGAGASVEVSGRGGAPASVRAAFAEALGRPVEDVHDDATFVGLGGDSLSYVEMSVRLESLLAHMPDSWHLTTVADLQSLADERTHTTVRPRRFTRTMETNVVLRGVAAVLIVGSHAGLFRIQGGAHVLLAVAGFNFARFRLHQIEVPGHLRPALASMARIAVPTALWIAYQFTYEEPFSWPKALFANNYLGTGLWEYWYVEALLQVLVVVTIVFSFRKVRELERRFSFGVAFGAFVAATALRYDALDIGNPGEWMYMPDTIVWCFTLGWAAHRARNVWQKLAVTVLGAVNVWHFFDRPGRELMVAVGLLLLVWVAHVRVPVLANRVIAALAAAALYVYLTQWAVFVALRHEVAPWLVTVSALAVGLVAFAVAQRVERVVVDLWRNRRSVRLSRSAAESTREAVGNSVGSADR